MVALAGQPEDALGWSDVSWPRDGVRVAPGGTTLTLKFFGGPEFDEDAPCSEDYQAIVEESPDAVTVRLQWREPSSQPSGVNLPFR